MDQRRAVMAGHGARASQGQSSRDPYGMLARSITCRCPHELSRGEHPMGQPHPCAAPDQPAKLPPRHSRGRQLRRGRHPG